MDVSKLVRTRKISVSALNIGTLTETGRNSQEPFGRGSLTFALYKKLDSAVPIAMTMIFQRVSKILKDHVAEKAPTKDVAGKARYSDMGTEFQTLIEPMASTKIDQVNLHHAKAMIVIITKAISKYNIRIMLAQELCEYQWQIRGLQGGSMQVIRYSFCKNTKSLHYF